MTSQGSAYKRFRRALEIGNPTIALPAALEVGKLDLADALELLVCLRAAPDRYPRAAARWVALLIQDTRIELADVQLAVSALAAGPAGLTALHELLTVLGADDAARRLDRHLA